MRTETPATQVDIDLLRAVAVCVVVDLLFDLDVAFWLERGHAGVPNAERTWAEQYVGRPLRNDEWALFRHHYRFGMYDGIAAIRAGFTTESEVECVLLRIPELPVEYV